MKYLFKSILLLLILSSINLFSKEINQIKILESPVISDIKKEVCLVNINSFLTDKIKNDLNILSSQDNNVINNVLSNQNNIEPSKLPHQKNEILNKLKRKKSIYEINTSILFLTINYDYLNVFDSEFDKNNYINFNYNLGYKLSFKTFLKNEKDHINLDYLNYSTKSLLDNKNINSSIDSTWRSFDLDEDLSKNQLNISFNILDLLYSKNILLKPSTNLNLLLGVKSGFVNQQLLSSLILENDDFLNDFSSVKSYLLGVDLGLDFKYSLNHILNIFSKIKTSYFYQRFKSTYQREDFYIPFKLLDDSRLKKDMFNSSIDFSFGSTFIPKTNFNNFKFSISTSYEIVYYLHQNMIKNLKHGFINKTSSQIDNLMLNGLSLSILLDY